MGNSAVIKSVDAFQVAWAPDDPPGRRSAFVRITTNDGLVGYGEASPMMGGEHSLGVIRDCAPQLVGADVLDHAVIVDRLYHKYIKLGPEGAVTGALAALDIALWDLKGKLYGQPIYTLLGDEALAETPAFLAFAQAHAALLDAYRNRQWASARQTLARLERSASAYGLERLYALYGERIAQFEQHPPDAGWDGVFTAMEKTG